MTGKLDIPAATLAKLDKLQKILRQMGEVLIAYSGGVDSTFLLKVASEVLPGRVLAVIASSETYPAREIDAARKLARALGVSYLVIKTNELRNPDFVQNTPLRCYHCKKELFSRLREVARQRSIPFVLDGANYEDRQDYRPGSRASQELGVRSPLREARLTKEEIRLLSKAMGLPTWNKPSLACLASRFPYATPIELENLARVSQAEDYLRRHGFSQVRVRHHGETARIEILPEEFGKLLAKEEREKIARRLKKLGYTYVTLDLQGYRTGSMNEPLGKKSARLASV